jgi:hypothetical protein
VVCNDVISVPDFVKNSGIFSYKYNVKVSHYRPGQYHRAAGG